MREFPELRKRYWGRRLWGKRYFCSTVGAVTEEIVKKYIEGQNEEDSAFKFQNILTFAETLMT
jgi:putative transposase